MAALPDNHGRRVIDDLFRGGADPFSDFHALHLLLLYRFPCRRASSLSHALLDRFVSLPGVMDAPAGMLREVEGMDADTAAFIKVAGFAARAYFMSLTSGDGAIKDIPGAKEFMSGRFLGAAAECLWAAGMGYNGKVIYCRKMSDGSPAMTEVSVSSVVKSALKADASRVVLAHNHPYGYCKPSAADIHATRILDAALRRVDIELFDHIIVAPDGVGSMREMGMLGVDSFR